MVTLNTPDVDRTSGVNKLPTDITDASEQITAACAAEKGSSFALVGRGGIQDNPRIALNNGSLWQDLQSYVGGMEVAEVSGVIATTTTTEPVIKTKQLQPITSWETDEKGHVQLVSRATNSQFASQSCRSSHHASS